jgi:hypothetical protein
MTAAAAIYATQEKVKSRERNVELYRQLTGRHSIPVDRAYWCLCSAQTDSPDSEINQLTSLGLLNKTQFVGVDNDPALIEQNRVTHPEAAWIAGDWAKVILATEDFNPALVNLDTTSVSGKVALGMTVTTLNLCPPDTVVLVNVMEVNTYNGARGLSPTQFISELGKRVDTAEWIPPQGVLTFDYASSKTPMRALAFYNGNQ